MTRWWQTPLDSLRDALTFAPVRPAIAAGVRAAVATVVPLAMATLFGEPRLVWAGLTGFLASIVDKGGAYRTRAGAMGSLTLGAAALATLGAVAGMRTDLALVSALVAATGLGMLRVYGGGASSVGSSLLVIFLVSLARPESLQPGFFLLAIERGAAAAAGGAWAMILALVLWPIRPYRPARMSVARTLRGVAAFAAEASRLPVAINDVAKEVLRAHRPLLRQSLEESRAILAATRRGRRGDSARGERLLVILESADQISFQHSGIRSLEFT